MVVSKVEPHPVWVLTCSPATLEYGRKLRAKAENARSEYLNGKALDLITLEPPAWASNEEEDTTEVQW